MTDPFPRPEGGWTSAEQGPPPPNPYGQPGPPPYGQPGPPSAYAYGPPPESYLVWGVLTMIFCFLPFGVLSVVKANSVATLWASGLYDLAFQASADAKKWAIRSAVLTLAVIGLIVLVYVVIIVIAVSVASST